MLIESGDIVLIADSQGVMDSYEATGTSIDSKAPVAVLVNKGTASASEVTTSGLTSHQSCLVWHCGGTTSRADLSLNLAATLFIGRSSLKTDRYICIVHTSSLHHNCHHIITASTSSWHSLHKLASCNLVDQDCPAAEDACIVGLLYVTTCCLCTCLALNPPAQLRT